jgi:hypothetical protein
LLDHLLFGGDSAGGSLLDSGDPKVLPLNLVFDSGLLVTELGLALNDGLGADGLVGLLVHLLETSSGDAVLLVLGELLFEGLLILLLQVGHVVGDVLAVDALSEDLLVLFTSLLVKVPSDEAVARVGDVETAIDGTLEGSKDVGACGRAGQTDVQEAAERPPLLFVLIFEELANSLVTGVELLHAELGQHAAGAEQPCAVGG